MRRSLLLLPLFACASKGPSTPPTVEDPGHITAEAELRVTKAVESSAPPPALLLDLEALGPVTSRLESDLRSKPWLRVERPRGFSFAGHALLKGDGPFRPSSATLLFVQPRDGEAVHGEPALLRLEGTISADAIRPRVEAVGAPAEDGDELGKIENANLRVLLGKGLDVVLSCAGSGDMDTHHWIRTVDAEGKPAAWRPVLEEAMAQRRLDGLAPYRVLVRRRRPADPVPSHYLVRLDDVIAATQMKAVPRKDEFDWVWEGVWSARLCPSEAPGPAAWPDSAPALVVRYKEYVPPSSGNLTGAFWHGVLTPFALGADIGKAFFEGDKPLLDSVAERQRQRN